MVPLISRRKLLRSLDLVCIFFLSSAVPNWKEVWEVWAFSSSSSFWKCAISSPIAANTGSASFHACPCFSEMGGWSDFAWGELDLVIIGLVLGDFREGTGFELL